jgi:hypothetical protein
MDAEAQKGKASVLKVVMTGGPNDGPDWQPHILGKKRKGILNGDIHGD